MLVISSIKESLASGQEAVRAEVRRALGEVSSSLAGEMREALAQSLSSIATGLGQDDHREQQTAPALAACEAAVRSAMVEHAYAQISAEMEQQLLHAAQQAMDAIIGEHATGLRAQLEICQQQDVVQMRDKPNPGAAASSASGTAQQLRSSVLEAVTSPDNVDVPNDFRQSVLLSLNEMSDEELLKLLNMEAEDAAALITGSNRISFALGQEDEAVLREAPVSFETPPLPSAADASSGATARAPARHLTHATKERPKAAVCGGESGGMFVFPFAN